MAIGGGSHNQYGEQQWLQLLIAVSAVAFFPPLICINKQTKKTGLATAGTAIGSGLWWNSGAELKLKHYLRLTGSTSSSVKRTYPSFSKLSELDIIDISA